MSIALEFFVQYAYAILFLWVLVEMIGLPIPSVPVLLTAGTLSATHPARINGFWALAVVLAACLIADTFWYWLGRRYGHAVLQVLCRFSFEASTCVVKTERYFERRGAVTLLFAKFLPGLSTVAAPIAGQTGMPYGRFVLYDMGGSALWTLAYILAGFFFGDIAQRSQMFFTALGHFAVVIFALMVLGLMFWKFWKQRKFLSGVRQSRLEPEELLHMIEMAEKQGNIPPFIVDLRHPLDYLPDPRVVPGSVRVSPADLTAHSAQLPRDRDLILYCTCPSEETSGKVALQLHKLGISRVRPLRGGFEGWRNAGYPLIEYVPPVEAAELTSSNAA
jgi:membrane protein DedA with SNARE-associated domain/rhodanese-related sulfurtransferase